MDSVSENLALLTMNWLERIASERSVRLDSKRELMDAIKSSVPRMVSTRTENALLPNVERDTKREEMFAMLSKNVQRVGKLSTESVSSLLAILDTT